MLLKYFCAVFPPLLSGKLNYQAMHPRQDYTFIQVKPLDWHSFCDNRQWEELGWDVA